MSRYRTAVLGKSRNEAGGGDIPPPARLGEQTQIFLSLNRDGNPGAPDFPSRYYPNSTSRYRCGSIVHGCHSKQSCRISGRNDRGDNRRSCQIAVDDPDKSLGDHRGFQLSFDIYRRGLRRYDIGCASRRDPAGTPRDLFPAHDGPPDQVSFDDFANRRTRDWGCRSLSVREWLWLLRLSMFWFS